MQVQFTKDELKGFVGGKIFHVVFTKLNGEERSMVCRLGVKSHLKGTGKSNEKDRNMVVFDMKKKQYRTVDLDRMILLSCNGLTLVQNFK